MAMELAKEDNEVCGLDNFLREGSRGNVEPLRKLVIRVEEGDIRNEADLAQMPQVGFRPVQRIAIGNLLRGKPKSAVPVVLAGPPREINPEIWGHSVRFDEDED